MYGKIDSITKNNGTTIKYTYDASGNRISKTVYAGGTPRRTWYTKDAQGNTMLVYTGGDAATNNGDLTATETYLYGSSRVGQSEEKINVQNLFTVPSTNMPFLGTGYTYAFTRGIKGYELSNHLGNVMIIVSDAKAIANANTQINIINSYDFVTKTTQDFYAFGMLKYGRRNYDNQGYRYGFNGKENDNDVQGDFDLQDYGARIYDPRLGRFLSVDPLSTKYPELTPYQFASNSPVQNIDLDGAEGLFSMVDHNSAMRESAIKLYGQKEGEEMYKQLRKGQTYGAVTALALATDFLVTRGEVSKFLFVTVPFASAFEHNRAKTPEGRKQQDKRVWGNLLQASANAGLGITFGKIFEGFGLIKDHLKTSFSNVLMKIENEATQLAYLEGSGPKKSMIELSARVKSTKSFENALSSEPNDFVFDPKSRVLLMGTKEHMFGHSALADWIKNASDEIIVGGRIKLLENGQIEMSQWSGHYGQNWNESTQEILSRFMKSTLKKEVKQSGNQYFSDGTN